MIAVKGISGLLKVFKGLEEPWCFFVSVGFKNEVDDIKKGNYFLAETEEEFDELDDMPDKYQPWLEYQIFRAIVENKLNHHPQATNDDILDAVVYYLEEDDFMD